MGKPRLLLVLAAGLAACTADPDLGESTGEARIALSDSTTVAGGGNHTCAVRWDGRVQCWGENASGQLGTGNTNPSLLPVTVGGVNNATAIAAGVKHSCALLADGRVQCWGSNTEGQLGNGSNTQSSVPVFVTTGGIFFGQVVSIVAGDFHTCAVRYNGTVSCWGAGTFGQLGNGASSNTNQPVGVSGLANAVTAAAGRYHSCASTAAGDVRCWGSGTSGQLGNGAFGSSNVPVNVAGLPAGSVEQITAGRAHTCALMSAGDMECWGDNLFGQLATAPGGSSAVPVAIPTAIYGKYKSAIAAGADFTCALGANGAVACWGRNQRGQLGRGNNPTPPPDHELDWVTGLPTSSAIGIGDEHGCAQLPGGTLQCWGNNAAGQLGDNTVVSRPTPAPVGGFGGGLRGDVAPGERHTCALRFDGLVKCWGANGAGQLGDGTNNAAATPVFVVAIGNVEALDSGYLHTCAVLGNGAVRCWGDNATYQLGDGTQNASNRPVVVPGGDVVDLALGQGHTCALTSTGRVRCWGDNSSGQIGDGTSGNLKPSAVQVSGLTDAVAIDAGLQHTCALRQTGQVVCWGDNSFGQLGSNFPVNASTPQPVTLPAAAVELGLGAYHSCAVLATGTVSCWGDNDMWQVRPNGPVLQPTPWLLSTIETAEEIAGGHSHSCALLASGVVSCWGSDQHGQIGNGGPLPPVGPSRLGVTPVSSLTNVNHLELGGATSFTIRGDGRLYPWGSNTDGELGDGSGAHQSAPVLTVGFP